MDSSTVSVGLAQAHPNLFFSVHTALVSRGLTAVNDVNAQLADSMKLYNTKLLVVGHYFCCTIPWAAYCGRAKRERDALLSSIIIIIIIIIIINIIALQQTKRKR